MNAQVCSPELRPAATNTSHLLRRLDWRFLLPNPLLGDVAYVGPVSGNLFDALKAFTSSLTVLDPLPPRGSAPRFDLVVMCRPNIDVVQAAFELVRAGGSFYVELRPQATSLSGADGSVKRPQDIKHQAKRSGFRDVQVNWHRPGFDDCVEIVSVSNAGPAQYLYSRRAANFAAKIKVWAGLLLVKCGLLRSVDPSFSITGTRPGPKVL